MALFQLPVRAVLDGEIVAFDAEGKPDFPLVCEGLLHGGPSIPLTFVAFDVLSVEGRSLMAEAYSERRSLLEELGLEGEGFQNTVPVSSRSTLAR